jgi:hypothetical protein
MASMHVAQTYERDEKLSVGEQGKHLSASEASTSTALVHLESGHSAQARPWSSSSKQTKNMQTRSALNAVT